MTNNSLLAPATARYLAELDRDPNLRSEHTRTQYASVIAQFERWRASRPLSVTLLESYLATLQQQGASPATVKQALAAVRWLARRAVKIVFDEQPRPQAEEFEAEVKRILETVQIKKSPQPLPAGRHLDDSEVESLLNACQDGTLDGLRDAAMIAVASATAIRNEELRSLTLADLQYTPDGGAEITIRHGKGDKARVIDLYGAPLQALTAWIEKRGLDGCPALFVRIRKSGQIDPRAPLTYQGSRAALCKRFQTAAVSQRLTWHDFRRTVIGKLFDDRVDISTILDITGHANPETAKRYDRRPADRRKEALRKIQGS